MEGKINFRNVSILICSLIMLMNMYSCDVLDDTDFFDTDLSIGITSPDQDITINAHDSVLFDGSISGGESPYYISWDFNDVATESTKLHPGYIQFNTEGTYTVEFHVYDTLAAEKSVTRTVTVTASSGDYVYVSAISPSSSVTAGEDTTFTVTLSYYLESSSQGELGISFNTDSADAASFIAVEMNSSGIVEQGTGSKAFQVSCSPVYGKNRTFQVRAMLGDDSDPSNPLAYGYQTIAVDEE